MKVKLFLAKHFEFRNSNFEVFSLYYHGFKFSPFAQISRLACTPTSFLPRKSAGEDEGGGSLLVAALPPCVLGVPAVSFLFGPQIYAGQENCQILQ